MPRGIPEKWFFCFSVSHHQLETLMEIQRFRSDFPSVSLGLCDLYYLPRWIPKRSTKKLTIIALQVSATLSKPLIHIIICNGRLNFTEWIQTDLVKHSTIDGYLGCLHSFFLVATVAAVNVLTHPYSLYMCEYLQDRFLEMKLLGPEYACFKFW